MKKLLIALLAGLVSVSILSACSNDAYLGGDEDEDDDDDEAVTTTAKPNDGETTAPVTTTTPSTGDKPTTDKPLTEEKPVTQPEPHLHVAGDTWTVDLNNHWKVCSCGEIMEQEAHNDAEECSVCGSYIIVWDDGMIDLTQYNDKLHCIFEAEYDENGNLLEKATYEYTYTANDQIETSKTTVYDENSEVVSIMDVSCTYDANGNLLTEINAYNNLADDFSYTTKCTYTYTDLDNVLTQTTEEFDEDGNLTSTYQIEYAYNELGMPITEKHYSDGVLTTMYFLEADEYGFPMTVKSYEYYSDGTIFVTEYEDYEAVKEYWTDADGNELDRSQLFDPDAAADLIGTWKGSVDLAELMETADAQASCIMNYTLIFRNDGTCLAIMDISYDDYKQFIIVVSEAMLRAMYTDEEFEAAMGMTISQYVAYFCDDEYVGEAYEEMTEGSEGVYYVQNGTLYTGNSWNESLVEADCTITGNSMTIEFDGIPLTMTKQ